MNNCKFCNKTCKNSNSLTQHSIRCKENPDRIINIHSTLRTISPTKCEYCSNVYNTSNALNGHQRRCKYNPNRILEPRPVYTDELRQKMSKNTKKRYSDPNERKRHSEIMKNVVLNNPESYSSKNVCGRVKNIEYNGNTLLGSWELLVAKFLDNINEPWEIPKKPFTYYWNAGWHLYFPDFYLPKRNLYIEVKGYERERDIAKWKVVPNLKIIKLKEINQIKTNNFIL